MQLISHGQSLSFKASFEIELGLLDFNMVSELPLGCWADLPPIVCPRVDDHATREGHIKVRVLSHIDQVFLGCTIYKP